MEQSLSPELRLLLAASWLPPANLLQLQQAELAELCASSIAWGEVAALARRHRIAPIVYHTLRRRMPAALPALVERSMKAEAQAAQLQALRHAAETRLVLQVFHEAGVSAIPLKGADLSQRLFGDLGLRQTRDVDLLVRPEDEDRAQAALRRLGYARKEGEAHPQPTPRQERHLRSAHYHYGFLRESGGEKILLELHWRRENCSPEHMRVIWDRSKPSMFLGVPARAMDEDMELLFLCDHGAHHRWFRIKWLSDVAILSSRRSTASWEPLCALAEHLDLSIPLAQAALLMKRLFAIQLPQRVESFINAQPAAAPLAAEALEAICGTEEAGQMPANSLKRASFLLSLRTRPDYRHHVKHLAISWADFEAFPLPDRFFWLYPIFRPLFWLRRRWRSRKSTGIKD